MAPIQTQPSAPIAVSPEADEQPPEIDFDFVGALAESEEGDAPATMRVDAPAAAPAAKPALETSLHAGFIVQRQGKLERVVAWNGDVLVAGRSADCDIHLAQDEVSRRHVRFERIGERFEVVDLGSVNGSFVNGRRVERQALAVGDVVQVEGFQLTFVLDRDPLDGAIATKPAALAAPAPREDTFAMTMLQEQMPHRPGFTQVLEKPGPGEDPPRVVAVEMLDEADLMPDDIEEIEALADEPEKPADAPVLRGSSRASSVQDLARTSQPNLSSAELRFELRVRVDLLPPALRRAFEEAGATELVLPAELRLKTS